MDWQKKVQAGMKELPKPDPVQIPEPQSLKDAKLTIVSFSSKVWFFFKFFQNFVSFRQNFGFSSVSTIWKFCSEKELLYGKCHGSALVVEYCQSPLDSFRRTFGFGISRSFDAQLADPSGHWCDRMDFFQSKILQFCRTLRLPGKCRQSSEWRTAL